MISTSTHAAAPGAAAIGELIPDRWARRTPSIFSLPESQNPTKLPDTVGSAEKPDGCLPERDGAFTSGYETLKTPPLRQVAPERLFFWLAAVGLRFDCMLQLIDDLVHRFGIAVCDLLGQRMDIFGMHFAILNFLLQIVIGHVL